MQTPNYNLFIVSNDTIFAAAFLSCLKGSFKNRIVESRSVSQYIMCKPADGYAVFLHAETFKKDEWILIKNHLSQFKKIFSEEVFHTEGKTIRRG